MIIRSQLKIIISTELPDDYHRQRLSDWESNAEFWSTYIDFEGDRKTLLHNIARRVAEISRNAPARILDLGIGEGMFLRFCHNQMPNAELSGIDFSQAVLDIAEKKSIAVPISLSLGDFEDENLDLSETFDIITAIFTFDEASDLNKAFATVGRYLKHNGQAVIVILDPVLESLRYNSLKKAVGENEKSPRLMLVSKHFYARSAVSPAPYYRIVRPVADYTVAARRNGLALLSLKPVSFGIASNDALVGPVANVLIFGKNDAS